MPDITLIFPRSPFLLHDAVFPPLGIMYLSAYAKQYGLSVQCLDMGLGHTEDMIESDIVGISFTTPQRMEAFDMAKRLNRAGKQVIAGGPHATHLSQECLQHGFTHVIRGYGERAMVQFVSRMAGKAMINPPEPDINDIPFPDRDALPIHGYPYEIDGKAATPIMTSRGCCYNCVFCGRITGDFMMQSAGRTIAEIEHIHDKYGFEAFMIYDDIFIASKKRLQEIADALEGRFIFRCFARSNLLDDKVCSLLSKLGVVEVGIGIESGSDEILERSMKGTTRKINTRAVQRLHNHGIRAKAFLIVGLPGETTETIVETAGWIEEAKPDDLDVSVLQPMPGSAIFQDPEKYGLHFSYNGRAGWYKGTPGMYQGVATDALTAEEIVQWRDLLELEYKPMELLR
jgi:anaerobic magnesium-protoporphyrin IX monomethyl ester cyclase